MLIIKYQDQIRMLCFFGIFTLMAILELLIPQRQLSKPKAKRWLNNIALVFLNSVLLKIIFPITAVETAVFAQHHHIGLINLVTPPTWLAMVVTVVLLDMLIYWQHRLFHKIPLFWRFHRMHHLDRDIDVTTGSRFHTVEIMLSMLIKMLAVLALGAPMAGVIVFEVILNMTAMFNHSNIRLPKSFDRLLRQLIVTPDMHRVHHSDWELETNSNYGFNLSIWDKLFSSYRAQPRDGHQQMTIGIDYITDNKHCQRLDGMLLSPLINDDARYTKTNK